MPDLEPEPSEIPDDEETKTTHLPDATAQLIKRAFSAALIKRGLDAGSAAANPDLSEEELKLRSDQLAAERALARELLERLGIKIDTSREIE